MDDATVIARAFHREYEKLAPDFGYRTHEDSPSVPWSDVPPANKALMVATVTALLDKGIIRRKTPGREKITEPQHGLLLSLREELGVDVGEPLPEFKKDAMVAISRLMRIRANGREQRV